MESLRGATRVPCIKVPRPSSRGVACLSLGRIPIVRPGAPSASSIWHVQPKAVVAALRLDPKTATAVLGFLPLFAARPFLARQESLALAALYCVAALRVRPDRLRSTTAIEVAMVAARETKEDTNMATIGNFTVNGNGFVGTVKTLALGTVKAKIVPAERTSDKAPDYRIFAGTNIEFGAVWKKKSQDTGREYHSVKLDDPSFPAPIYATLVEVEGEEGYSLIWSRPSRD